METLEALRQSMKTAKDLHSVVRTMKALAAVGILQYQKSVAALEGYRETLEQALQVALQGASSLPGSAPVGLGMVVIGSDQGMCGTFNQAVTDCYRECLQSQTPDRLVMVGSRLVPLLAAQPQPLAVPTSISGISAVTQSLVQQVESWPCGRILICYNRALGGARYQPACEQLLPLDRDWLRQVADRPWPRPSRPFHRGDRDRLFSGLIRQWLFLQMYRSLANSLAAENAARLASMQAAEKNIRERLQELKRQFHQLRQTTITSELLDIVSGFEVITGRQT